MSATPTRWPTGRRRSTASPTPRSASRPGCSTTTSRSYELIARAFAGNPGGLSRDDVLDNVTHYWLTNTAISSARLYWESKLAFFDVKGVEIPVGVTVFPDELYPAPQSWAERAYPKLVHYNRVDEGGHFAAWEQPQTFSDGDAGDVQVAAVTATAALPVEGRLPDLDGATAWLNSAPLTPARPARRRSSWSSSAPSRASTGCARCPTCRAWAEKYRDDGLVVLGVHSPEFPFEHDLDKIRSALDGMGIDYPVAVDNEFAVWRAFDNAYWPALYFVDAERRGSGTTTSARRTTSGRSGSSSSCSPRPGRADVDDDLVAVEPDGVYLGADWETLESPETYVGYARATGFASPGGLVPDRRQVYREPSRLALNEWALVRRLDGRSSRSRP